MFAQTIFVEVRCAVRQLRVRQKLRGHRKRLIIRNARRLARQPRQCGSGLCSEQLEIVQHAQGNLALVQDFVKSEAQVLKRALTKTRTRISTGFSLLLEQALQALKDVEEDTRPRFAQKQRECIDRERDLDDFRRDEGITEELIVPPSTLHQFLFMLSLAIIEGTIAGTFLQGVVPGGFIGATLRTIAVSGLSMAMSYLGAACGTPLLRHRRGAWRVIGAVVVFITIIAVGAFEFKVASYRLALSLDPELGSNVLNLFAIFDGVQNFESMAIWLFGVANALFGFYHGFNRDRNYPGHVRRVRALEKAQAELENLQAVAITKVEQKGKEVAGLIKKERYAVHRDASYLVGVVNHVTGCDDHAQAFAHEEVKTAYEMERTLLIDEFHRAQGAGVSDGLPPMPELSFDVCPAITNEVAVRNDIHRAVQQADREADHALVALERAVTVAKSRIRGVGQSTLGTNTDKHTGPERLT